MMQKCAIKITYLKNGLIDFIEVDVEMFDTKFFQSVDGERNECDLFMCYTQEEILDASLSFLKSTVSKAKQHDSPTKANQ